MAGVKGRVPRLPQPLCQALGTSGAGDTFREEGFGGAGARSSGGPARDQLGCGESGGPNCT